MKIFDPTGPVAAKTRFEPRACCPTRAQGTAGEIIPCRNSDGIAVGIDAKCGSVNRPEVLHLAIREPAGAVEECVWCERKAQACAHGAPPIEVVLMRQGERRIEAGHGDGRIADGSRAGWGRGGALVTKHQVAFEAGHGHARLPVIADLAAAGAAVMLARGAW